MKVAETANFVVFQINGVTIDGTGYRKLAVSHVSGTLPDNGHTLYALFARSGNQGAAGAGAGDMEKVVYDTNDDGKVNAADAADSVPWSGITSKPTAFTPDTHTHPQSDITGLVADLSGKSAVGHVHIIADTTGLQDALDGKQASGSYAAATHTHAQADITDLVTDLAAKQAANAVLTELTALTDPAATRIAYWNSATSNFEWMSIGARLTLAAGVLSADVQSSAAWGSISGTLSAQTDLQSALDAKAPLASPTFTGTPAAPTAAAWVETTQIATTDNVVETVRTVPLNAQTGTTYTLVLTDAGKFVRLTNAAAITLTIPTNASVAFPINTRINLGQGGAGQVTVGGASVTIRSSGSKLKLTGIYSGATLLKVGTDEWWLIGDSAT